MVPPSRPHPCYAVCTPRLADPFPERGVVPEQCHTQSSPARIERVTSGGLSSPY